MHRSIAGICVGLAVLVAGCGSNAPGSAPVSDPSSSSGSQSSAPAGGASPSPATTPSSAPGVAPASGPLVTGVQVTFHIPQGWKQTPGEVSWERRFENVRLEGSGQLLEMTWPSKFAEASPRALNELVGDAKDRATSDTHWHRLPNLTIAGLPFYHLRARPLGDAAEEYGTMLHHRQLVFSFYWLAGGSTPAQQRKLTAQVLASVRLR